MTSKSTITPYRVGQAVGLTNGHRGHIRSVLAATFPGSELVYYEFENSTSGAKFTVGHSEVEIAFRRNVHSFGSTGEAYDACQCDDEIQTGDVLVIENEKVAGVAHTWPVAVTREAGKLHQLAPGYKPEEVGAVFALGFVEAKRIAAERGWEAS